LEAQGFRVSLQYAENNPVTQVAQIKRFVDGGARTLIVAPVDVHGLTSAILYAAERGVRIISYDQLILDTPYISVFVGFDAYHIGIVQAKIIEDALGLDRGAPGPFNMEVLAGPPTDFDAGSLYQGGLSLLKPHFDAGKLRVPSGLYGWPAFSAPDWSRETARRLMAERLADNYRDEKPLHAVWVPTDEMALGVIDALKAAGYSKNNPGKPIPVITGMGCDEENVRSLLRGEQMASVFKDPRVLADTAVAMTDALDRGVKTPSNVSMTYRNGAASVPVYICPPSLVYKDNVQSLLVDSGFYDNWELK
jgi:putative multiple sugar transport system substrate-binding protein